MAIGKLRVHLKVDLVSQHHPSRKAVGLIKEGLDGLRARLQLLDEELGPCPVLGDQDEPVGWGGLIAEPALDLLDGSKGAERPALSAGKGDRLKRALGSILCFFVGCLSQLVGGDEGSLRLRPLACRRR